MDEHIYGTMDENKKTHPAWRVRMRAILLSSALGLGSVILSGCASPPAAPPAPDTPQADMQHDQTTLQHNEHNGVNTQAQDIGFNRWAAPISPHRQVNRFMQESNGRCAPVTGPGPNEYANDKVAFLHAAISPSPLGRYMWTQAANYKLGPAWICFNNALNGHGAYYGYNGVIVLNDNTTPHRQVGVVAHEMAHLVQEQRGQTLSNMRSILTTNEHKLHFYFAREAAAEATAVQTLWEIKQGGYAAPWNNHNSARQCRRGPGLCYKSISDAFAQIANTNPSSVTNGAAMRAAVYAWYTHPQLVPAYRSLFFSDSGYAPFNASPIPHHTTHDAFAPLGDVPVYDINYIEDAGGLRNILTQPSPRRAAFAVPRR